MNNRRLEYFEDQLDETALGREALSVIEKHSSEVWNLVSRNRQVMLVWNRNKGPVFIKSFMDSGFEEDVSFVREVENVRVEYLLLQMSECLMDNGSPELKKSIGKYAAIVFRFLSQANSLKDIMKLIREHSGEKV